MQLSIPMPPSYRFEAMIDAHGWAQLKPFSYDNGILERIEQLSSGTVALLRMVPSNDALAVDVAAPSLVPADITEIEQRIRWMLELDEDFAEFYRYCAEVPTLQHIPARCLGPMLRGATVWEDYVKTVCTTNTTWAQTRAMVQRMVDTFGAPYGDDGPRAFPTPAAIAAQTPDAFALAVRAGYRAPYIYETAADIAAGRLDLERYKERARAVETPLLMRELRTLRGIGPYAAAHLALLLGSYGHIPVDSWARSLVQQHIRGGEPVTDHDVHAHFERFGRWKALAFRCWRWES